MWRWARKFPSAGYSAAFASASLLVLVPAARLDFDRHHSGYVLAQAIAVHAGTSIHDGVAGQYGPVTPWLQSLALYFPASPALSLQLLNALLIAVTLFLLADMGRRCPEDWPDMRGAGWAAAFAWLVLCDVWIGVPMFPWSSTLAAALSVGTLYALSRAIRCSDEDSQMRATLWAMGAGAAVGLMPFTRINVGLASLAVIVVLCVVSFGSRGSATRRLSISVLVGAGATILACVAVLISSGAVVDYFMQAVLWPLQWGGRAAESKHTLGNLRGLLVQQAVPLIVFAAVLVLQFKADSRFDSHFRKRALAVFTVCSGLLIVVWEQKLVAVEVEGSEGWSSLLSPSRIVAIATTPNTSYIYLFFFTSLLVIVGVIGCASMALLRRGRESARICPWLLTAGLGLASLTQVVPTWDTRHVWWGAPIPLLLLFVAVDKVGSLWTPTRNSLWLPLVAAFVMATLSGHAFVTKDRVDAPTGSVLAGMRVEGSVARAITEDQNLLARYLQGAESAVFLVSDGDLSILSGTFRSADAYFVSWGDVPLLSTRLGTNPPIIIQRQTTDAAEGAEDEARAEVAKLTDYQLSASNGRLLIYTRRS